MSFGGGAVNALEEAAQRFWTAQRRWRGIEDPGDMTIEELICELNDLHRFRGAVAFRAQSLLDDVIHDRRPQVTSAPLQQTN